MSESSKPRLIGDIEAALAWYGRLFAFTLRGKGVR
jgi:hypothetical protein